MAITTVRATLVATKWGPAIDFNGKQIFLEYSGDVRDFKISQGYSCEVHHRIIFQKITKKVDAEGKVTETKNWVIVQGEDEEHLMRHPELKDQEVSFKDSHHIFFIRGIVNH
jgi:hypothetical protein